MRVLILNQFFYPDISATSQLMTDLAEDLAEQGVEVTALCSNASYVRGESFPVSEMRGRVRIERAAVVAFDRSNIFRRLASYLSFYVTAFLRLLRLPRQDVILVLTTPPLIVLVAYAVRVMRGSKFVYLVQDVYPDIAYEFGLLRRGSLAARFLDSISGFLLRQADAVIVLGSCMQERLLAKGLGAERIKVIPNWADGRQIQPLAAENNPFRREHGLEAKFVVLYSGNMGRAHDFTPIFQAMLLLAAEKDIVFVFIGSGDKKQNVLDFARQHPEANVRVLDYVPREQLAYSMGASDLCILAVADGLEGLVVPSKLYGIMAAGKAALYVGPEGSEAARVIRKFGCGFVVGNEQAALMADSVRAARDDRALAESMGRKGRDAFDKHFERRLATFRYLHLLEQVSKG